MAHQLAKRVTSHPTLCRGAVRLLTLSAAEPAEKKEEEVVEKYKSPYLVFNKSDPLNLDSLLSEDEKMIRYLDFNNFSK